MEQFPGGDGDEGTVGAEPYGGDGLLKGDAVEDDAAGEVDEQAAIAVIDGKEEVSVGRDGDAGDI